MVLYYLSGFFFLLLSFNFLFLSFMMMLYKESIFMEWMCMEISSVQINLLIYFDWISMMFIFTVLMISSMIMIYCTEYMSHDLNNNRFFYLVFLFIMSMLMMILSPNMVSILIGWDGLGLVSYCLVIYYQSFSSYNSGMLTVLMNRIGDVFILMSVILMISFGSMNYLFMNNSFLFLMFLIIIASFTKSAQFPFSSWLPAAMAAPTPVSSLVHSSTLVTAGVYLLIRFHYLMYKSDLLMMYILFSGLLTMMFAGLSANFEFDIKKIIAYSTLSQLGLMMMIYSLKFWDLAYFHLLIHAMFKSMMFMCSGVMIHSLLNFQDIRYMGCLKNYMPMTLMIFMLSNFSLCGLPFMSGFYSKDKILEMMFMNNFSFILFMLLMFGTGLTVSYSIRLSYYLMTNNLKFIPMSKINDFKFMNFSMLLLLLMSMMFGWLLNWLLFNNIENIFMMNFEKMMILILCFLFFFIGKINFKMKSIMNYNFYLSFFFGNMWFLYILNKLIIFPPMYLGKFYYKVYDKGWSEFFMKNTLYYYSKKLMFMNLMNINLLISFILMLSYMMIMILIL